MYHVWNNYQIRQSENQYFNAADILDACHAKYSVTELIAIGLRLMGNLTTPTEKGVPFIVTTDDNVYETWLHPFFAQQLSEYLGNFELRQLLGNWFSLPLPKNSDNEKPKPLMDSNEFHWFCNVISCLEETGIPEDMELARLLRENLRSKI
jgi:hypothetical protein